MCEIKNTHERSIHQALDEQKGCGYMLYSLHILLTVILLIMSYGEIRNQKNLTIKTRRPVYFMYSCICMFRYQFKAKPINPDVFLKGGLHGVPRKKSEVQLTEAHTPVLATTERSRKRKAQEMSDTTDGDEEEQTATTFHAQPMPNFTKITVSLLKWDNFVCYNNCYVAVITFQWGWGWVEINQEACSRDMHIKLEEEGGLYMYIHVQSNLDYPNCEPSKKCRSKYKYGVRY